MVSDTILALKAQTMKDEDLNNKSNEIKEKYNVSDKDWKALNIYLSTFVTRRVVEQIGGRIKVNGEEKKRF